MPLDASADPTADPVPRPADAIAVAQLRQLLLWPLRLMPPEATGPQTNASPADAPLASAARARPWQVLLDDPRWVEVIDEVTSGDGGRFKERHYREFVAFLPHVQRFLYGEGSSGALASSAPGAGGHASIGSPMRVFRRRDVAALDVVLREGDAPRRLRVPHVDLYFFFDVDVVLLNVEWVADDLTLAQAQDLMYRIGRAYPSGWDAEGRPLHGVASMLWRDAEGAALSPAASATREAHMAHVAAHRTPLIDPAWSWLLAPLHAHPVAPQARGATVYRQIDYHRMPMMAWLAVDDPRAIGRDDWVRLGLVTEPGRAAAAGQAPAAPFSPAYLADFEARHVDDRFWHAGGGAPYTRYLLSGHALVVVGDARSALFRDAERGVLAQFRHQHFLLFLIAHFQKAALLAFADRLVSTLELLNVGDADSVRRFKRSIRIAFEAFLRFTHRYWFHDVSEQAHMRSMFRRTAEKLGLNDLYDQVKARIVDMADYLEADSVRRQSNTVVRLTVVTILGLVGTITTGVLGMNLLAEAESPLWWRVFLFVAVLTVTGALTMLTVSRSKQWSDALDALADDRLPWRDKVRAVGRVLRPDDGADPR